MAETPKQRPAGKAAAKPSDDPQELTAPEESTSTAVADPIEDTADVAENSQAAPGGGTKPIPDTFTVERLLGPDGPKIAGVAGYVVAGALHESDPTKRISRDELQEKIQAFYDHEVTEDDKQEAEG